MQKESNQYEYAQFLFTYTKIFNRDIVLEESFKSERILAILTPSNEAFLLLCIKSYFNAYIDLELEGYDLLIKSISKVGWTAEGIQLYNSLYHRVMRNCETFDEEFDVTFLDHAATLFDSNPNKRRKAVHKLIPIAHK